MKLTANKLIICVGIILLILGIVGFATAKNTVPAAEVPAATEVPAEAAEPALTEAPASAPLDPVKEGFPANCKVPLTVAGVVVILAGIVLEKKKSMK